MFATFYAADTQHRYDAEVRDRDLAVIAAIRERGSQRHVHRAAIRLRGFAPRAASSGRSAGAARRLCAPATA